MRIASAIVASVLLAACAQAPQRPVNEGPTQYGQRDLTVFVSFFSGNWDPRPGEPPVRLRVAEFWKGSPVRWLYLEWVRVGDESKAVRQLVFRIAEDGEEKMTTTLFRLPGETARFVGEWRKPEPFAALRPADLLPVEGCRLMTVRAMIAHFIAVTEGNRCPGDLPGVPFMRFEFSFSSSELALLEQPRDAAGNVPPSRYDPYQFGRTSTEPK